MSVSPVWTIERLPYKVTGWDWDRNSTSSGFPVWERVGWGYLADGVFCLWVMPQYPISRQNSPSWVYIFERIFCAIQKGPGCPVNTLGFMRNSFQLHWILYWKRLVCTAVPALTWLTRVYLWNTTLSRLKRIKCRKLLVCVVKKQCSTPSLRGELFMQAVRQAFAIKYKE